jgi:CubicO group peptidase (beta-lactamase class C family)
VFATTPKPTAIAASSCSAASSAAAASSTEALHELILDPLRLHDAVLQPQERPPSETAHRYGGPPRIARALRIGGRYAPYPSEASWLWTAGGMVASPPSVARFADALLRGELLSPDSRRQLLRFVPAAEGYDGYGLGVAQGQIATGEVWGHFGGGPGFVTVVSHLPAKEITVAALSSGDADLGLLTQLLAEAALQADQTAGRPTGRDRAIGEALSPERSPDALLLPPGCGRLRTRP